MNIDEYRALVAQQEEVANQQEVEQTQEEPVVDKPAETQEETVETKQEETTQEPEQTSNTVFIDGVGEVTFDELKNGYLRQSDYTKKTQDVARQRREVQDAVSLYEHLKKNPEIVAQLSQTTSVPTTLDPTTSKIIELENALYDMMLEREIETLQNKYDDFEVREVLEMAKEKNLDNLEDAYKLVISSRPPQKKEEINIDDLKEQIRKELLSELQQDETSTQTIITTNGGAPVVSNNEIVLSEQEKRVAKMMKMSEKDYATWRDAKR